MGLNTQARLLATTVKHSTLHVVGFGGRWVFYEVLAVVVVQGHVVDGEIGWRE